MKINYTTTNESPSSTNVQTASSTGRCAPPAMIKFRFMAEALESSSMATFSRPRGDITTELAKYSVDIAYSTDTSLQWWSSREPSYPLLAPLAQDVISTPASEAYVECIFSVSGYLSAGKRNRSEIAVEHRVFLKLNKRLWALMPMLSDHHHDELESTATLL